MKNLAITGDININVLDENDHSIDLYKFLMAITGLESLVNEPTRLISNTCIDHFYVRVENKCKMQILTKIEHLHITDHSMIVVFISINDVGLESLDWSPVYSLLNASKAFDRFHYQGNNKQH